MYKNHAFLRIYEWQNQNTSLINLISLRIYEKSVKTSWFDILYFYNHLYQADSSRDILSRVKSRNQQAWLKSSPSNSESVSFSQNDFEIEFYFSSNTVVIAIKIFSISSSRQSLVADKHEDLDCNPRMSFIWFTVKSKRRRQVFVNNFLKKYKFHQSIT